MLRIGFQSSDLAGFDSPSPDDHLKIFLPAAEGDATVMRDYTPRAWDVANGTLTIDFAIHPQGPATEWATHAKVGDTLSIGGPKGSTIVTDDFDWYLLVGDATALPSIGRRLETLRSDVPVTVLALIADDGERQEFSTKASSQVHWLLTTGSVEQDASVLRTALQHIEIPKGAGFVWIASEASVARALYQYVIETRKHPKEWVKAAAYWSSGGTGSGGSIA
jgi:NADPH-dependent ferric siderophore reductase